MDRGMMAMVVAAVALAAVVSAAATYLALQPPAAPVPPAAPPASTNTTAPSNATANATGEPDAWVFVLRGTAPGPNATSDARGTVAAVLTKARGDLNTSAEPAPIGVELAAVRWTAFSLTPPPNGTILDALNLRFSASPPVSLARAALSRSGDAAELTVPTEQNVSSVVVHAPASGEFLIVDWPSGGVYGWSASEGAWLALPQDTPPTLLARPLG